MQLSPMITDAAPRGWYDHSLLHCPDCGPPSPHTSYVHLRSVESYPGSHDGRMCARLVFECEGGHWFQVTFDQHKGETFVSADLCGPGGRA